MKFWQGLKNMLSDNDKGKWAINFDLDTKDAEKYHPSGTRQGAYEELKKFFEEHDFEHRQYSGYVSKEEITNVKLKQLIERLLIEQPYITSYVRRMDATLVRPEYMYDCTSLFAYANVRVRQTEKLEKQLGKENDETEEYTMGI